MLLSDVLVTRALPRVKQSKGLTMAINTFLLGIGTGYLLSRRYQLQLTRGGVEDGIDRCSKVMLADVPTAG